jgi:two-component system LytT family sensor kinase
MVAGTCVLLILFAFLRRILQQWLTRVVFRRGDIELALREMREQAALHKDEDEFLRWAAARVAGYVSARQFELVEAVHVGGASLSPELAQPAPTYGAITVRNGMRLDWAVMAVPIRASLSAPLCLLLGRRSGGRRYLSEDLSCLNRLAACIVEELERFHGTEMQRLVSQAEMKALQSQINPHFLFNALNTIYGIIPREVADARRALANLADIFRYFLQGDKAFIALSEELRIVSEYLEIERLRLGPRLQTEIDVDESVLSTQIPSLCLQPLVENAVKHGVSSRPGPGRLQVTAKPAGREVVISVEDTGPGMRPESSNSDPKGAGLGLANVTRRLQLCYGPQAGVRIETGPDGTTVRFSVPLT